MIKEWLLGSRKFLIMVLIIAVAVVFRIFDLISGSDLASLLSSTGVAFMGANTVEHMFGAVKEWISGKDKAGGEDA